MTYSAGEAAILTLLRAMSDWSSSNTSRGDHLILSNGSSAHFAVLRQGETSSEPASIGQSTSFTVTQTIIQVWQALNVPGTDLVTLEGLVDNILREIEKYPYLNQAAGSGYWVTGMTVAEPLEVAFSGNNVSRPFYMQEIAVTWQEERTIAAAE